MLPTVSYKRIYARHWGHPWPFPGFSKHLPPPAPSCIQWAIKYKQVIYGIITGSPSRGLGQSCCHCLQPPQPSRGLTHWGWDKMHGRHFPDDIFKCIFLNENVWISIKISLKFVPKGWINNIPALVQIMAWRRPGDKPLSEPIMVISLMHRAYMHHSASMSYSSSLVPGKWMQL